MGYYLSKTNRTIVDLIFSRLIIGKEKEIEVNNPTKVESIIRSATKLEEYNWVGKEFIISIKENRIRFIPRQVEIKFVEEPFSLYEETEFFDIINILLNQDTRKERMQFEVFLSEDEINHIMNWATLNNYRSTYKDKILKLWIREQSL